jgi:hypothetical protein
MRNDPWCDQGWTITRGKAQMLKELWAMLQEVTGLEDDKVLVSVQDNPAGNAMEAGTILPEPQHEAEWFAKLAARPALKIPF